MPSRSLRCPAVGCISTARKQTGTSALLTTFGDVVSPGGDTSGVIDARICPVATLIKRPFRESAPVPP